MRVSFSLATRTQMQGLFIRMSTSDCPQPISETGKTSSAPDGLHQRANGKLANERSDTKVENGIFTLRSSPQDKITPVADLTQIASDFARRLPENVLTPAEIQGFLLTRKKEPIESAQRGGWLEGQTLGSKNREVEACFRKDEWLVKDGMRS